MEARDRAGMTPLHAAILAGSYQEAEILITMGADVKATAADRTSALHLAAATGQPEMVRLLIEHGADPSAKDNSGSTSFDLASRNQHPVTAAHLKDAKPRSAP